MEDLALIELSHDELKEADGGWIRLAYWLAVDTITHWETYKAAFWEGFEEVRNQ